MQLDTLQDVLVEQMADLYSAEQQLVSALPKMASAAHSQELRHAFEEHLHQTQGHVDRLDKAFAELTASRPREECEAMKGLIQEGEEVIGSHGNPDAIDAALIAAAQRIEHYEIAAYGTAKELANQLGFGDAASLLGDTLDEEAKADALLTKLATGGMLRSGINAEAAGR